MTIHSTLYKRDSSDAIRLWFAESEGDKYRTHAGQLDGAIVTTEWTVCEAKNVGRANETTPKQQCQLEVEAMYTKRLKRRYHEQLCDVDNKRFIAPMLAKKYDAKKVGDQRRFSQPKLDGVRAVISLHGMSSREGQPIFGAPHIFEALQPYFESHPAAIFDGELYNHDYKDDFNTLISIIRNESPSSAELTRSRDVVQYHIYDLPSAGNQMFIDRWVVLCNIIHDDTEHLRIVPTTEIHDQEQLDTIFEQLLAEGYEGQMIRLNKPHDEDKRSSSLLKRKEFMDEEFIVRDIQAGVGNWAGHAKRILWELPNGDEFGTGLKGNKAFAKQLLEEKEKYIGKPGTVRFLRYTPAGVPRGGVAYAFHPNGKI
ncbi:MAG: hypothetical protein GC184_06160 [Rhizobiales bacterium]|nr:hypothetical protein [Hyphomicrobiales bacterium]